MLLITNSLKFFLGATAFRSADGSPFVQIFCKVLSDFYEKLSLREMMCKVSAEIQGKNIMHLGKRMPVPSADTSSFKDIYFSMYLDMFFFPDCFSDIFNYLNPYGKQGLF